MIITIIIVAITITIMKPMTTIKTIFIIKLMAPCCHQLKKSCIHTWKHHGQKIKWFFTDTTTEP